MVAATLRSLGNAATASEQESGSTGSELSQSLPKAHEHPMPQAIRDPISEMHHPVLQALDAAGVGVAMIAPTGDIWESNPAFARIADAPSAGPNQNNLFFLFPPDNNVVAAEQLDLLLAERVSACVFSSHYRSLLSPSANARVTLVHFPSRRGPPPRLLAVVERNEQLSSEEETHRLETQAQTFNQHLSATTQQFNSALESLSHLLYLAREAPSRRVADEFMRAAQEKITKAAEAADRANALPGPAENRLARASGPDSRESQEHCHKRVHRHPDSLSHVELS